MSAGSRHQLAVLLPWLLVAVLQVRFGSSGPALAAAMAAERSSAQKAVIRVVPFQLEPLTLEGVFAGVAEVMPAEGKLLQPLPIAPNGPDPPTGPTSASPVGQKATFQHFNRTTGSGFERKFHPLSLCNSSEDELTVPGFVSIVKLEPPDKDSHPCLSLANKAKLAGERGARAVLFDITNDQTATEQLRKPRGLNHPVVLIWGHDAERLMGVVNNNREAHVKIEVKEMPVGPDYDVWILLTLLSTVLIIASIFVVRTRCQPRRSQTNVQEETLQAINRLATRRYQACRRCHLAPAADSASSCSSAPVCAICLEEFSEGQELRVITCLHEFHRQCVDPWLQEHQSCPLCMFNILECLPSALPTQPLDVLHPLGRGQRPRFFRQHPGRAMYRFPLAAPANCSSALPQGYPFFHSPELSHLDLETVRYLPYRPVSLDPWCSRQPPQARSLPGPCLVPHEPPCRALRAPPSRGIPLHRGIRRGKHHLHHHHHHRSGGETYLTEPSGYLPDGPGSDSSSGPCHGSSSDSVLNCTDVSLQAIHGSCSTFHSSLSSDYDPMAFSETLMAGSGPDPPVPRGDPQPLGSRATGRAPLASRHVHYHHHHHRHHHYGPPDCLSGQMEVEAGLRKARTPGGKGGPPAQKRTEKRPWEGSLPASPKAACVGWPDNLLRGQDGFSSSEGPDAGRTDPRLWTPQKPHLHIRANRRKCRSSLDAPQAFPPEGSPLTPNPSVPGPPGSDPGPCCSPEAQPLLAWDPFKLPATSLPHVPSISTLHSTTEPQEEAGRGRQDSQTGSPRPDAAGHNASLNLNRHPRQQLQGSDDDDILEIYEHSV